jgi:hypothetical protein
LKELLGTIWAAVDEDMVRKSNKMGDCGINEGLVLNSTVPVVMKNGLYLLAKFLARFDKWG